MHTHSNTSIFTYIFFHLCEAYDKRCMGLNFALVNRDLVEWATIFNVNLRKCSFLMLHRLVLRQHPTQ